MLSKIRRLLALLCALALTLEVSAQRFNYGNFWSHWSIGAEVGYDMQSLHPSQGNGAGLGFGFTLQKQLGWCPTLRLNATIPLFLNTAHDTEGNPVYGVRSGVATIGFSYSLLNDFNVNPSRDYDIYLLFDAGLKLPHPEFVCDAGLGGYFRIDQTSKIFLEAYVNRIGTPDFTDFRQREDGHMNIFICVGYLFNISDHHVYQFTGIR